MNSHELLISIQPKWCAEIANSRKTIEVRKNRPKLKTPFNVYIYCTKAAPYLVYGDRFTGESFVQQYETIRWCSRIDAEKTWGVLNGKVIGEFVCDEIFPIELYSSDEHFWHHTAPCFVPGTMLTDKQIVEYLGNGKTGYGWHISQLNLYDVPHELSDFNLRRPPQSWCYVNAEESARTEMQI